MFNHDKFFEKFRPFYKKTRNTKVLPQNVVIAVGFLLNSFEQSKEWKNIREIAYGFATIAHETAWTFRPIKEYRAKPGTPARRKQDRYWMTGYYGRGYCQLTWLKNYQKAAKALGVDVVNHPDLVLEPSLAFKILTRGMHEGWFTTKKLSTYINNTDTDYFNARRVINGTDKARLIATYAEHFEEMLEYALESISPLPQLVDKTVSSQPTNEEVEPENPQEFDDEGNPIEEPHIEPDTPVDGYPEEPKPGEPVPEEPAKAGEPVTGGRPGDTPVEVPETEPTKTSGWGAWVANIRAQIASLGIGGISLTSLAFLKDPLFIQIALWFLAGAALVSATVFITTMVIKHKEKMRREQWAHEETLRQLEINSDPTKYNVELVKVPKEPVKAGLLSRIL